MYYLQSFKNIWTCKLYTKIDFKHLSNVLNAFDSYECVGLLVLGDFVVYSITMRYDYHCFVVYEVNGVQ